MTVSIRSIGLLGLCALLAACGGPEGQDDLNALDARLTNGATGNVAGGLTPRTDAEREAQRRAGGRIDPAPAAIASQDDPAVATLGGQAGRGADGGSVSGGAARAAGGNCANSVRPGTEWAARMPEPFRLYPRATLVEAAGNQTDRCRLRVISFTTDVPIDRVLAYYYTQAKRAGYDAEHLLVRDEHQLGGTKGDLAYVVFARSKPDGASEVDIIANVD